MTVESSKDETLDRAIAYFAAHDRNDGIIWNNDATVRMTLELLRELKGRRAVETPAPQLLHSDMVGARTPRVLGKTSREPQTCTEKDAARYEWLRANWKGILTHTSCSPSGRHVDRIEVVFTLVQDIDPQSLDHAIDAAMQADNERSALKATIAIQCVFRDGCRYQPNCTECCKGPL